MKTLTKFLTAVSILSLASCTVYETPVATQPPPPPPVAYNPAPAPPPVYNEPAPAPAPAPAPVYSQPAPAPAPAPAPETYNQPVTMQTFYDALSPYGQWVNYGGYGYVWIPAAGPDFMPYSTAGHWVFTDNGWMWASDYSWGWATFHYGRWDFDAVYGWMWIPDTQWGPAWVQWRSCNGYYGWAPLQPNYGWNNYGAYNPPANRWVFCNGQYMTYNNISVYYEPRERYNDYIQRSTVINRSYYDNGSRATYAAGPEPTEVSRYSGSQITPVHIAPATGPGATTMGNGGIQVYRPAVTGPGAGQAQGRPMPQHVAQITEVQPVAQRTTMIKPEPQRVQPTQQQPQQRVEPVQQQQRMEPAQQQQPQRTQPTQQQPAPQRTEPGQQQPQPQRTEPAQQQQPAPQRTEPAQQQQPAPQRTSQPAQQQQQPQKQQPQAQKQPKPTKQKQQAPQPVKKDKDGK
ncbi:MAG TPA: DUF6600 domain-containing protein [Bacteroidia bacterium]|nr:DUF6600 domain-containing protein [Bacteroidia bacterium]